MSSTSLLFLCSVDATSGSSSVETCHCCRDSVGTCGLASLRRPRRSTVPRDLRAYAIHNGTCCRCGSASAREPSMETAIQTRISNQARSTWSTQSFRKRGFLYCVETSHTNRPHNYLGNSYAERIGNDLAPGRKLKGEGFPRRL